MKIVIIGCGKVGQLLTDYLSKENHDIVVIDVNQSKVEHAVHQYDVIGLCGNGANYDILKEAGVHNADMTISVTASDELNILAGLTAKMLGSHHLIARVRNPDYLKQKEFLRDTFGFSMIINPEEEAASEIRKMITFPSALKIDTFSKINLELAEIKLGHGNKAIGLKLSELNKITKTSILICAISRGDEVFIPSGDFLLKEDDHIHVTGTHKDLNIFSKDIGVNNEKIKNVMIVGASRLAYYLTKQLSVLGIKAKIIERDHEKCIDFAERLPYATIIEADGSDEDVLLEEGIERTDGFICLTGLDEENIILSMAVKKLGAKKSIAKINRTSLFSMVDKIGIDNIVSPKNIIASKIVGYVRAKASGDENSSVRTLYKIVNDQVEALEFVVTDKFKYTSIKLLDMKIKKNILIAGIYRNNQMIVPKGNDTIELNDHVIVVSQNSTINKLSDIIGE